MTYLVQSEIAANQAITQRVAQCVAEQGRADADWFTQQYRREWAASPGWDAAWASGKEANKNNTNYDPGKDEAVITDAQILSEIQVLLEAHPPTTAPTGPPPPP